MKDQKFLMWIHERLEIRHRENPILDYMNKLRAIIAATDPEQDSRPSDSSSLYTLKELMNPLACGACGNTDFKPDAPDWCFKCGRRLARKNPDEKPESPWKSCVNPPKSPRDVRLVTHTGQYMEAHYLAGGHCVEDHPPIAAGWYHWTGTYYEQVSNPAKWMDIPK